MIPARSAPPPPRPHHHQVANPVVLRLLGSTAGLDLPPATTAPAPAPPSVAAAATAPHEVFGYAPYWSLPQQRSFPVGDFSTLAYFAVDVNPDGTVQQSGPGWDGYQSQDLVDLVSRAHAAGDRVVLTATDFSQPSLDAITHDPSAGRVLGREPARAGRGQAPRRRQPRLRGQRQRGPGRSGPARGPGRRHPARGQPDVSVHHGHLRLVRRATRTASTTSAAWRARSTPSSSWPTT